MKNLCTFLKTDFDAHLSFKFDLLKIRLKGVISKESNDTS